MACADLRSRVLFDGQGKLLDLAVRASGGRPADPPCGLTDRKRYMLAYSELASKKGAADVGASPSVTIVMPTHDRLPLLMQAVDSIRSQSRPDWHLVIADDHSTDGTAEYLATLADSRIQVLRSEETRGPAPQVLAALRYAQERYVAKLDDDDWWEPHFLELLVPVLDRHPNVSVVYSALTVVTATGIPAAEPPPIAPEGIVNSRPAIRLAFASKLAMSTALYRTDVVRAAGAMDVDCPWAYDFAWTLKVALAGHPMYYLPVRTLNYRLHPGSRVTTDRRSAQLASVQHALRSVTPLLQAPWQRQLWRQAMARAVQEDALLTVSKDPDRARRQMAWAVILHPSISTLKGLALVFNSSWLGRRRGRGGQPPSDTTTPQDPELANG